MKRRTCSHCHRQAVCLRCVAEWTDSQGKAQRQRTWLCAACRDPGNPFFPYRPPLLNP